MSQHLTPNSSGLDYYLVDVFTEQALKGNPLAVVFDTAGLSADQMQRIAIEFNLSETTFVQRRSPAIEQCEGIRVRIFTTAEELDFAGHPTLGTAAVLRTIAPEMLRDNVLTLAENVGPIPVRFSADGSFAEMTQRDPEFGPLLDPAEVAPLLSLSVADLDPALPPQIVSTGTAFAIAALSSLAALAKLDVRQQPASGWLRPQGARWFYVLAPTGDPSPAFRARMQFHGGEDPATGSAAGCAISYLVRNGVVASGRQIHLRQGVEIDRPSDLYLSACIKTASATLPEPTVSDVRVGGSTVLVAKGRLFLP